MDSNKYKLNINGEENQQNEITLLPKKEFHSYEDIWDFYTIASKKQISYLEKLNVICFLS